MSSHRLVIKDAFWQILGRIASALCGFVVLKIISPYLGPLRYGDYATILKFFAYWSAFADFGLYVIAVKRLGVLKSKVENGKCKVESDVGNEKGLAKKALDEEYGLFTGTRVVIMSVVYFVALILAYFLPAYTSNVYLIRGLPIGMIFSASFMMAGIVQLPLQIYWKMEKLSIGLVLARIAQIIILVITVFVLFPHMTFDGGTNSIIAFCLIIFSVLVSGVTQGFYVRATGKKYMPLKVKIKFSFIKDVLVKNWQYGLSYFLSSFHTLIVLFFLSLYFPTIEGFREVGLWGLALALLEIFLIVPSALGNSMLHKVAGYSLKAKRKSFGNFLSLIFWIGGVVFLNFLLFNKELILLVSGKDFLGTSLANPGSNIILPFLGIVLWMSFLKQVFNYVFVATDKQNVLLGINAVGVFIGLLVAISMPWYVLVVIISIVSVLLLGSYLRKKYSVKIKLLSMLKKIGVYLGFILGFGAFISFGLYFCGGALGIENVGFGFIPKYGIRGGLFVQILLEILFMLGAFGVALRHKVFPCIPWKYVIFSILVLGVLGGGAWLRLPKGVSWNWFLMGSTGLSFVWFFLIAIVFNGLLIGVSLPIVKRMAKGLTD